MKKLSVLVVSVMMVVLLFLVLSTPASAQSSSAGWKPSKAISLIVGHGPGGGFDNWARATSVVLKKYFGVPVVVKNVSGLGGVMGIDRLWRSKPDGRTIHLFEGGAMLSAQYLLKVNYNVHKLSFIGTVQIAPFVIYAATASPLKTIQDALKAGKTGTLRGGTTGLSSGLWQSMAVFAAEAGLDIRPVAGYKSGGDLLVGLEAGDFDLLFLPVQTALASLERGSVRALAVAGSSRDPRISGTPTFAEAGLPKTGAFATVIRALAAPPGTPPHIAKFFEKAFLDTMKDPKLLAWVKSQNDSVKPLNAQQTRELFKKTDAVITTFLPILKKYIK